MIYNKEHEAWVLPYELLECFPARHWTDVSTCGVEKFAHTVTGLNVVISTETLGKSRDVSKLITKNGE